MTLTDKEIRQSLFKNFSPQEQVPIGPEHLFYVPLFPEGDDPILQMQESIGFTEHSSMQLFSGCRGSGKTTQLRRLAELLESDGYIVVTVDALDYFNPAQPIDAREIPIVLGAMLSEAMEADDKLGRDPSREGFLTRFVNLLNNTNVTLDELGGKVGANTGIVPGGSVETNFKLKFRTTQSFREQIGKLLSGLDREARAACHKYFEETRAELIAKHPRTKGLVFILDAFEQLRGDVTNSAKVIESVLHLFTQHEDLLQLPCWKAIYTVPPWLHIAYPGCINHACFLPTLKLWKFAEPPLPQERHEPSWETMRKIVAHRIGLDEIDRVFPPGEDGHNPVMDHLIEFSGGHIRDLFLLITKCVLSSTTLPFKMETAGRAVFSLADSMPITDRDSLYLRDVRANRSRCLPDRETETVTRFAQLTDFHLILEFRNGKAWFDIHPAIREAVETTARQTDADPRRLEAARR